MVQRELGAGEENVWAQYEPPRIAETLTKMAALSHEQEKLAEAIEIIELVLDI